MWPSLPKTYEAAYLRCNKYTFGDAPGLEGKLRSCWCEPKPNYIPSVCVEKEDDLEDACSFVKKALEQSMKI